MEQQHLCCKMFAYNTTTRRYSDYLKFHRLFLFQINLAVFAAYVLSSDDHILDPDKIFVTFSLVNGWNVTLQVLPNTVNYTGQVIISIRRIRDFLLLEEADDEAVKLNRSTGIKGTTDIYSGFRIYMPYLNM